MYTPSLTWQQQAGRPSPSDCATRNQTWTCRLTPASTLLFSLGLPHVQHMSVRSHRVVKVESCNDISNLRTMTKWVKCILKNTLGRRRIEKEILRKAQGEGDREKGGGWERKRGERERGEICIKWLRAVAAYLLKQCRIYGAHNEHVMQKVSS